MSLSSYIPRELQPVVYVIHDFHQISMICVLKPPSRVSHWRNGFPPARAHDSFETMKQIGSSAVSPAATFMTRNFRIAPNGRERTQEDFQDAEAQGIPKDGWRGSR